MRKDSHKDYAHAKSGFTLVEILFSMLILTTLLMGILSLSVYCLNMQETSKNTTNVLNQMRATMEEIKAQDFNTVVNNYSNAVTVPLVGINGTMTIQIVKDGASTFVSGSNNSLIIVRITTNWTQKSGRIIAPLVFETSIAQR